MAGFPQPNVSVTGDAVGGWLVDMHDGTQRFLNWSGAAADAADAEKQARAAWDAKYEGTGLPASSENAHSHAESAHSRIDELQDSWDEFREEMRGEIRKVMSRFGASGGNATAAPPSGMRVPGAAAGPVAKASDPDPEDDDGAKGGKAKRGKT